MLLDFKMNLKIATEGVTLHYHAGGQSDLGLDSRDWPSSAGGQIEPPGTRPTLPRTSQPVAQGWTRGSLKRQFCFLILHMGTFGNISQAVEPSCFSFVCFVFNGFPQFPFMPLFQAVKKTEGGW